MLIDWFTVGAQALNFLILVWLMKRFLYKPILNAIDTREKLIATELADAAAKKTEAQKEHEEFDKKNEQFDQQRAALQSKAQEQAKAEGQLLIDQARKAADDLRDRRLESLVTDARNLNQAITRRAQSEVFSITQKALRDLAATSLEDRMGEVFTRRLRAMDGAPKEALGKALKTETEPALIRSAFDMPAEQRATIQNALNQTFSADIHLRFQTAPELISGIELVTNGQKVGWTIAGYLSSLQQSINDLLKPQDKPAAKPEPKPEIKPEPKTAVNVEAKPIVNGDAKSQAHQPVLAGS
jgi:F-type H+-transporting ATPase subunit b